MSQQLTLRTLVDAAMQQIETYKHPDIGDAKERLNGVLVAAGLGDITKDYIESLNEYNGILYIETSWSARGCPNNSSYELPVSVIDAANPVEAAKAWGLDQRIISARNRLDSAERE